MGAIRVPLVGEYSGAHGICGRVGALRAGFRGYTRGLDRAGKHPFSRTCGSRETVLPVRLDGEAAPTLYAGETLLGPVRRIDDCPATKRGRRPVATASPRGTGSGVLPGSPRACRQAGMDPLPSHRVRSGTPEGPAGILWLRIADGCCDGAGDRQAGRARASRKHDRRVRVGSRRFCGRAWHDRKSTRHRLRCDHLHPLHLVMAWQNSRGTRARTRWWRPSTFSPRCASWRGWRHRLAATEPQSGTY